MKIEDGEMKRARLRRLNQEYKQALQSPMSPEEIDTLRNKRYALMSEIQEIEKMADEQLER